MCPQTDHNSTPKIAAFELELGIHWSMLVQFLNGLLFPFGSLGPGIT